MIVFGLTLIAASVIGMILTGGFQIDLLSFALLYLGCRVRAGSQRAAWWSVVLMGYYAVATVAIFLVALLRPAALRLEFEPAPRLRAWALAIIPLIAAWCLVTLAGLVRVRRKLRERQRQQSNLCPHCGYNLTGNISGVCPECGSSTRG